MAIRDEDLLNEGLKVKAAAGMIPPPEPKQTQQTPPPTQQTPPPTTQKPTVKVPYDTVLEKTGFTQRDYDTFRTTLAKIESGGEYDIAGGSNKHYDGRYQLGAAAKTDGARTMGVPDPGHDTAGRQAFRSNADNQEQIFAGYTITNHNHLMKNAPGYASKTKQQQLQILGYAHNQGMGGAAKWIETGVVGSDGFGTKGTKYTDSLRAAYTLDNETVAAETAKSAKDTKFKTGDFIVSDGRALPTIGHALKDAPKIVTPTTDDPSHSVVKGDTLGAIAKKNNTSVEEIMKSNPDIKDPNKIEIDQKIKIRTIKKESYKDKIRMYLREAKGQLPGSSYGELT
jgi:LysM repeat protein